jgi:hypothetical protein
MDWIDLVKIGTSGRARVNTVIMLRILWNAGEFLSSCTTGGLSRRPQLHEVS